MNGFYDELMQFSGGSLGRRFFENRALIFLKTVPIGLV
jgi:hypothetical protein